MAWCLAAELPGAEDPFCSVLHLAVATSSPPLHARHALSRNALLAYEVMQRVKFFAYTAKSEPADGHQQQRCLSVLFPIWYKCHQPQYLSAVVCALLWALSLLMSVVAALFCSESGSAGKSVFHGGLVFSFLIMGIFTPVMVLSSVTLSCVCGGAHGSGAAPTRLCVVSWPPSWCSSFVPLPLGISWYFLYWLDLPKRQKILALHVAYLSSALSSSANPII
ncbi:mas-related G-protein coupled receptor member D-like [Ursus maritimus]|uniref:Mas-related G-protein coupled receptor member D-like n=1 Tax=Ursus maritimus TaxID=29073 RepID=A0A8M1GIF8_URSMA|nr:mas-related G-protein coupled receptor member D-like [Ursus maritimus]